MMQTIGLYVHIPFCRAKCAYCDFNSYAGREALYTSYLAALRQETILVQGLLAEGEGARAAADRAPFPRAATLYVGGGTPTALPASDLAALVVEAREAFSLSDDAEVTVEANPGTVDRGGLRALLGSGVNRLSLGVQSFDDRLLRLLGRIHTAREARTAANDARQAGFENLSLDLMLGLPRQTMESWQESVWRALELGPGHLSLYALAVEEGTPLAARIEAGHLPPPDDDLAADMYEWAEDTLARAGYVHYEISNWALPGHACRHNLTYWRNEPYLGLGAGAHSWWNGRRWANHPAPEAYVASLQAGRPPEAEGEAIDRRLELGETMMMGLRLLEEGVSFARFQRRFGVPMDDVYAAETADLVERGLLERTTDRVRLTRRGHLLGNQVFVRFLGSDPAP
ncbi:MAG: radical SAM family heme chaperone HemW [Anaerolineae bacterium]|nr:radical SAM family heme chaperone HemW [Anaerolineae bacterium]